MSLRDEIRALKRYDIVFHPDHGDQLDVADDGRVVYFDDVLRIVDNHAAPVVDMTKGGTLVRLVQVPARPMLPLDPDDLEADEDETHAEYIARLRAEVAERTRDLEHAMSRTSLYDHEQEMLEYSEMELAEALEAASEPPTNS